MYRRNGGQIGIFVTGLIAIVLVVILPLQYIAKTQAESVNSNTQAILDDMVARVQSTHKFTEKDYLNLMETINISGAVYDLEISTGTRYYGIDDADDTRIDTPIMTYTNEIIDEISANGYYEFGPGDTITFRLVRRTSSAASQIANSLLDTSIEPTEFISGGVVGR